MTIGASRIARSVRRSPSVDEWLVRERQVTTTVRDLGRTDLTSQLSAHEFEVTLLSDSRTARGQAQFTIDANADGDLEERIRRAAEHASESTGPLWRLPRPAAPARVLVSDQRLASDPLGVIADSATALASLRSGVRVTAATISVVSSRNRVILSSAFEHEWPSSEISLSATLALGEGSTKTSTLISRTRRRASDLDIEALLSGSAEALALVAGAERTKSGVYDLVISSEALRPGSDVDSWLSPLGAQASGKLAQSGLSRYQPGQLAFVDGGGDPINAASDGTIDFARQSAPVDDWGGPVRRFRLIENGKAVGLALESREAALRGSAGNGGARNLLLGTGERSFDRLADGARPRLVVTRLDSLRTNPSTGEIAAQVGLATSPESNQAQTGGHFTFNLFDVLGSLRLSGESASDPLGGPAWIALPGLRVF